jgi:hypothetical protein
VFTGAGQGSYPEADSSGPNSNPRSLTTILVYTYILQVTILYFRTYILFIVLLSVKFPAPLNLVDSITLITSNEEYIPRSSLLCKFPKPS